MVDLMKEAIAVLRIEFPSEKRATVVLNALRPETKVSPTQRSRVEVKREGRNLTFFFEARDTTALRASINSYTRWVMAIEDVLSETESAKGAIKLENNETKQTS